MSRRYDDADAAATTKRTPAHHETTAMEGLPLPLYAAPPSRTASTILSKMPARHLPYLPIYLRHLCWKR